MRPFSILRFVWLHLECSTCPSQAAGEMSLRATHKKKGTEKKQKKKGRHKWCQQRHSGNTVRE